MLENLSPATVETLAQIAFALILLVASALGIRIGFNKKQENEGEVHEIKGAIISDAKAQEIIRYMDENTRVTIENTRSNMELVAAINLLREGVKDAKQEIKDVMRDFREDLRFFSQSRR